jgi:hypothetical protein
MADYYIGADVHSNNPELIVEHQGKIVQLQENLSKEWWFGLTSSSL